MWYDDYELEDEWGNLLAHGSFGAVYNYKLQLKQEDYLWLLGV